MIKEIRDKVMARPFAVIAICLIGFLIIRNAIAGSPFKTYPAEEILRGDQRADLTGYLNKIEFSKGRSALYLGDAAVSFDSKEYPLGCVILNIKEETFLPIGSFIKAYGKSSLKDRGIITDDDLKTSNAGYDIIPDDMELPPVDKPLFKPL